MSVQDRNKRANGWTRDDLLLWGMRASQLFALLNLAVTRPLFELLGRQPAFFVAHDLQHGDVVAFAVLASFGPPLILVALEWCSGKRLAPHLHRLFVGLLAALLFQQAAAFWRPELAVLLATVLAIALVAALRWRPVRIYLAFLSLLTCIVPMQLISSKGVRSLANDATLSFQLEIERPAPVILIVFDELPLSSLMTGGVIDPVRFPAFAALAARSNWYPNAVTVAPFTSYAVPAILTGNQPSGPRSPVLTDYPRNLFTLLGGSMNVSGVEPRTALCPAALCPSRRSFPLLTSMFRSDIALVLGHVVLPRSWTQRLPSIEGAWAGFGHTRGRGEAMNQYQQDMETFLGDLEANEREPSFSFLHLMLPHVPWRFLPTGDEYTPLAPLGVDPKKHWTDTWAARQGQARHLLQLAYADRLLGTIMKRVEELGMRDEALVIVTSDHGCNFEVGNALRSFNRKSASAILPIPLLVKTPGQTTPAIDRRFAETTDIVPTILDVLGVPSSSWDTTGRSLLGAADPKRTPTTVVLGVRRDNHQAKVLEFGRRNLMRQQRRLPNHQQILGTTLEDLFRVVPHPALKPYIGSRAKNLPFVGGPARRNWRLLGKKASLVPRGPIFPITIRGVVKPPATHPVFLAIAVNGIVEGFTRTVVDRHGKMVFDAMLPPKTVKPGRGPIKVIPLHPDWEETIRSLAGSGPVERNTAP